VSTPPSKKEVMLALLERAEARVHLDARRPGVILPQRLLGDGHVRLDYAYGFTPPIPDLVIDDEGIHATLSFNRQPAKTFIPWTAIYLIADYDGHGAVWPEDIPPDLLEPGAAPTGAGTLTPPPPVEVEVTETALAPRATPARPRLAAVPDDATPTGEEQPPPAPPPVEEPVATDGGDDEGGPPRPRRPSHLKLVK
jgi:stringent starvation protein B